MFETVITAKVVIGLVGGLFGALGAFLGMLLNNAIGGKSWSVEDPGPSYFAVYNGHWFVYKINDGGGGHRVLKRFGGPYWDYHKAHLLDHPLEYPDLYGFRTLEEAVAVAESLDDTEFSRDGKQDRIIDEAGKHVFFRTPTDSISIEGDLSDVDDLGPIMEAQFGDEDLSDVKLGSERMNSN